ncbi:MAG: long-chain-fatty-acid--CoA ligase [Gemmatimonadetes bacterium]|nr:long-chain-fatty-acid--CoA ligase [Gemmatimonadota bacterium]
MMDRPLMLDRLLQRAATWFGEKEVVTAWEGGARMALPWREVLERAERVGGAMAALGVVQGDRVASLAWNTHRHLELYFGVPAAGAILHTVNVRLSPEQVVRLLRHAGDRVIFADPDQVEAVDAVRDRLPDVERFVVLAGAAPPGWEAYETLLATAPAFDGGPGDDEERAAALCYTSGTTGEPRGVLYSHRALVLHTMGICLPDAFGLGEAATILPAVPMFHANAWGLPFAAAMTGATLVLPGPRPSTSHVARLLADEGVTFAAGVPTVWLDVLAALRAGGPRPERLRRIHSGGAPTPSGLVDAWREEIGVEVVTGWGMTELSPVGMASHPRGRMEGWPDERLRSVRTAQGTPLPLVEARIMDASRREVPRDGVTPGELEVRGPWVTAGYFGETVSPLRDGWLPTGDVATVDADGYVRLVDRSKDLIRSGGEWIASVQLENALMDQPGVAEAAVVAVPHPRWGERPWACVVPRGGAPAVPMALLEPLRGQVPDWWLPDRVLVVDAIPRTATGKFDKKALRDRLAREVERDGTGG